MTDIKNIFPATVIKVIDEYKIVINRGEIDDIKNGQRFLVYALEDEPLVDPDTGESLGNLEIVRGTGKVTHVQKKISTIESDKEHLEKRIIKRRNPISFMGSEVETITPKEKVEFDYPEIGDKVKPI